MAHCPRIRSFGFPALAQRVVPAAWASRQHPVGDPFGASAQSLAMLGRAIRGLEANSGGLVLGFRNYTKWIWA